MYSDCIQFLTKHYLNLITTTNLQKKVQISAARVKTNNKSEATTNVFYTCENDFTLDWVWEILFRTHYIHNDLRMYA